MRLRLVGELPREPAARAGVVLQVVRLVEDEPRPLHAAEALDVLRQDVVVDDHPLGLRRGARRLFRRCAWTRRGAARLISRAQLRFTDAGQTTRYGPVRRDVPQRDDRLARLAEAHVVGEDGALPAEQERDAFDLVRKEPLRQRGGAAKRRVDIVRREGQQPGEGVGLRVEGSIGQLDIPFLHLLHQVVAAAHGQRHDRQRRVLAAA